MARVLTSSRNPRRDCPLGPPSTHTSGRLHRGRAVDSSHRGPRTPSCRDSTIYRRKQTAPAHPPACRPQTRPPAPRRLHHAPRPAVRSPERPGRSGRAGDIAVTFRTARERVPGSRARLLLFQRRPRLTVLQRAVDSLLSTTRPPPAENVAALRGSACASVSCLRPITCPGGLWRDPRPHPARRSPGTSVPSPGVSPGTS